MTEQGTFVDLVLSGDVDIDDAEKFVEAWHESDREVALHEFLGLRLEEYEVWVERSEALNYILAARRHNFTLAQVFQLDKGTSMAARFPNPEEAQAMMKWLKDTGRVGAE